MERGATVVDNRSGLREVWFPDVLALILPGDDGVYGAGGLVAGVLDQIRVQPRLLAHIVDSVFLQLGLAGGLLLASPGVVCHVVGGQQTLVNRLTEKRGVSTDHIEFHLDSPPHYQTAGVSPMALNVGVGRRQQSVKVVVVVASASDLLARSVRPEAPPRHCCVHVRPTKPTRA